MKASGSAIYVIAACGRLGHTERQTEVKCADCKWWKRLEVPGWAESQPERWANIMREDPYTLDWGECTNSRGALMRVQYWDVHTRDIFGCVQFEPFTYVPPKDQP